MVTGANGMLGSQVCSTLSEERHEVLATDIDGVQHHLDVTDFDNVRSFVERLRPDMLFR